MDSKALFSLSYGIFMLASKHEDRVNGCIINTCIQTANEPTRVSISCIATTYTCELIKRSKQFTVSILDNTCTYETIKHFGLQSGRDVNKFEGAYVSDNNGIPYLNEQACAMLSCHVVETHDLGSHIMFIGEVDDAKVLSNNSPILYAEYHSRLKPKVEVNTKKKIIGWRCKICGYLFEGEVLPKDFTCPLCGHDASDFEPVYE